MPSTEQSITLKFGFAGRINLGEEEQEAGQRPQLAGPYSAGTKTPLRLGNNTLVILLCCDSFHLTT